MSKPDFFIVGAPKCGTTALYQYLKQHPKVFMSPKEIYFFGKDFTFRQQRPGLGYYQSLFNNTENYVLRGDASVWYLYSTSAAKEIYHYKPDAKIIIMLRKPSAMLYSLHSQQLYAGNENITSFETALQAEPLRRRGEGLPPLIGCPYEATYYSEVAKYYQQVKRYFDVFGKQQVHIILLDDWAADTQAAFNKCLQFLDLSTYSLSNIQAVNTNKKAKNKAFRNLLKQRPAWLVHLAKYLLPSRKLRFSIQEKLWQMNTAYIDRTPISPETENFLNIAHRYDIEKLADLIGIDLSNWY